MRPAPKLIDPNLLNKVNEVYIAKTQQSNSILVWMFDTFIYYCRQNIIVSVIVIGLICFLLYRYFENIKKKNKILKNLNSDKPIEIKLDAPIDYNNNPPPKTNNDGNNLNDNKVLSEISINLKQEFDKELENDLKLVNDPNQTRIQQNPQQNQQHNQHEINPMIDRMPIIDPKIDPDQIQYRSTNPNNPSNVIPTQEDNMNEEVNYSSNILQKSNVPQVQGQCGIDPPPQYQQPKCGLQPKKNAYLEESELQSESEEKPKKKKKNKNKKKDKRKSKKDKKKSKKNKKKDKRKSKKKDKRKSKKNRMPDRHELEIMNIFEREMAITHGSINKERSNKDSRFKPSFLEDNPYDGPKALNTFSDNFQSFL